MTRFGDPRGFKPLYGTLLVVFITQIAQGADLTKTDDHLLAGFREPPNQARPSTYWLWLNGYVNRDHVERELAAFHEAGIRGVCIFDMGARGAKEAAPPAGPAFMSDQSVADIAHALRAAERLGMDVQLSVASSWDMGGSWVEPQYGSMGLFATEVAIEGPSEYDEQLPFPATPAKAPRRADGLPAFFTNVAVLALPLKRRLPGHDFVFRLDPPGIHTLDHAILYNTLSSEPKPHGEMHLFAKDFSIAVLTTEPTSESFREVLRASLEPTDSPQRFELPAVPARFARLRLLNGHNTRFAAIQLGEFELFDTNGVNLAASHVADRSRDGAELIGFRSAAGHDRSWTAENIHDGAKSGAGGSWSSAGPPPIIVESTDAIIDLTDRIQPDGRLKWSVPAGQWAVLRLVCANTGERLKVPSPASDGLATDHLSREATQVFLDYEICRLQSQLGDLGATALKQLYLASYEVRGMIWTPDFTERFRHYRGYEMTPYLPALLGNIIVSDEITQRFIYDYRKTLGDLLVDAYYRAAVDAAHAAGLGIESEAGGPGPPIHQTPVDALLAQGTIDEIRGEFWPKRPDADQMWVVKETACAGHIYEKTRIHMEAFTSMHHWQDGPFDLKPSADRAFCEGANHFVWHTASHLPPESGKPGWVYHAGTHLNTNIVWWPKAKSFLDYLARCSFLLQQGEFVGDVCYYYGDQGFNFVPPKHVDPSLGPGFDYDVVNRDVILHRMSVRDGQLTLPGGMKYAVLVLPDRTDIDLEVLLKVEQLVQQGATIVGPKPTRSNGLTDYPRRDGEVRNVAHRLWGPCDGQLVTQYTYGEGNVVWGRTLRNVLRDRGITPDFSFESPRNDTQLDFIHRRTPDTEIYFVSNPRPRRERVDAEFRVHGKTPELWAPDTGHVRQQFEYQPTTNGVVVPLELASHGSTFVVFRKKRRPPIALSLDAPETDPAARIEHWDSRQARIRIVAPGSYRLRTSDGRSAQLQAPTMDPPIPLDADWALQFPKGWGAPAAARLDRLISWTDHDNESIRHFSGIAEYRRGFELPDQWLAEDRRVLLDLGDLRAVGDVVLNGQPIGVLWKPPYIADITSAAVAGHNTLRIEVANTWSNRLVADANLPPAERLTRTNVTHTGGVPWKDAPLLRSGLFGPVRVIPARISVATPK